MEGNTLRIRPEQSPKPLGVPVWQPDPYLYVTYLHCLRPYLLAAV
jgi:hypothetical protein